MRKKVAKKKLDEETTGIVEVVSNILSSSDLLGLETLSRDLENAKLRMALEEQYLSNLSLEAKNLEHKIRLQGEMLNRKAQDFESAKARFKTFKEEMWPKYKVNIKEGLGYNPETGEIVSI